MMDIASGASESDNPIEIFCLSTNVENEVVNAFSGEILSSVLESVDCDSLLTIV